MFQILFFHGVFTKLKLQNENLSLIKIEVHKSNFPKGIVGRNPISFVTMIRSTLSDL